MIEFPLLVPIEQGASRSVDVRAELVVQSSDGTRTLTRYGHVNFSDGQTRFVRLFVSPLGAM